jgi:hypothetical protein
MGLSIHILVQSLDFPSASITTNVLTNCLRHEWFYTPNVAVARKAATDLGDPSYEEQIRSLRVGERIVKDHQNVYREYVEPVDDPWSFPGLARKKAERALEEIQQGPDYRSPELTLPKPAKSSFRPDHQEPNNPNLGI